MCDADPGRNYSKTVCMIVFLTDLLSLDIKLTGKSFFKIILQLQLHGAQIPSTIPYRKSAKSELILTTLSLGVRSG